MSSQVETNVGSTVLQVAQDIIARNEYDYYYLFSVSPVESYLIQSDTYENGHFGQSYVIQFEFVHDDDDNLTDWRMVSYNVDIYTPVNNENYIVYTNAIDGYPVLRGDVRYVSAYYFAGLCVLCTVITTAILFFRIWRVNHG